MSATISTIPDVIDALVRIFSVALPDAQVSDGQPLDIAGDVVCVGFNGTPGAVAVTSSRTRERLSADPDREQYEITCMVSSYRGAQRDSKLVRDGVYALVDTMASELARDQTLGGLVMRAMLTTDSLSQYQTTDGATADVEVTIHVDGFTRRS